VNEQCAAMVAGSCPSAFWHLSVVQPSKNRYNLPTSHFGAIHSWS
jgi:hypothetical protein